MRKDLQPAHNSCAEVQTRYLQGSALLRDEGAVQVNNCISKLHFSNLLNMLCDAKKRVP